MLAEETFSRRSIRKGIGFPLPISIKYLNAGPAAGKGELHMKKRLMVGLLAGLVVCSLGLQAQESEITEILAKSIEAQGGRRRPCPRSRTRPSPERWRSSSSP